MIPLLHCFYMLVLWQQEKYILLLWGIELGPLRRELAASTTMLQTIGEFSKHINLNSTQNFAPCHCHPLANK